MPSLFEQLYRAKARFVPESIEDYLGLRFAFRLGDAPNTKQYAALFSQHDPGEVIEAHHRVPTNTKAGETDNRPYPERLQDQLERSREPWPRAGPGRLCAFKVQRRLVAVAVFAGLRPEFLMTRHLASDAAKAEASALGFVSWMIENFEAGSAALEEVSSKTPSRRLQQSKAISDHLRRIAIPAYSVEKREILRAFALPPPRTRTQVRRIVCSIYPMIGEMAKDTAQLDAVALGLHVQAERLFILKDNQDP